MPKSAKEYRAAQVDPSRLIDENAALKADLDAIFEWSAKYAKSTGAKPDICRELESGKVPPHIY